MKKIIGILLGVCCYSASVYGLMPLNQFGEEDPVETTDNRAYNAFEEERVKIVIQKITRAWRPIQQWIKRNEESVGVGTFICVGFFAFIWNAVEINGGSLENVDVLNELIENP